MFYNARMLLLTDLRHHIAALGYRGGATSPSVYDTAQVLRLCPPAEGLWPALDWLRGQQHDDGGWGDPVNPRARTLPTLAAVLALHLRGARQAERQAVQQGLAFLRRDIAQWGGPLPSDLPSGIELLLPRLADQARQAGLDISPALTASLDGLADQRRRMLAKLRPVRGTTIVHSWEAWGSTPDPALMDDAGSIGHNPAATAAWLAAASDAPELQDHCARARRYLVEASASTDVGIPGVVPTGYPFNRFEQTFSLYMLLLAGLFDEPALSDVIGLQLNDLARAFHAGGIGFSDYFAPDGDNTAAVIALFQSTDRPVPRATLEQFACDGHYVSWQGELQPAISVTAHALHALGLSGVDISERLPYILEQQLPDGRWLGDKWNASWLYSTWQTLIVLPNTGNDQAIARAVDVILAHQDVSGGWGAHHMTVEETAYVVLALSWLARMGLETPAMREAQVRGVHWLKENYRPLGTDTTALWLAKELYRPRRLSRIIELAAMLTVPHTARKDLDS